jgi:Ulp1 family protease
VKQALGKPADTTLISGFNVDITPKILGCMRNGQWLNDEVINFYMQMIMARASQNPEKYPSVHCFNTFFFSTLDQQGYAKVRRWTKKVQSSILIQ